MVISCFHLWQFQVFNSGVEGLVVVMFWFDLWGIFFLPTTGFELGTSGSLVLHSTTAPAVILFFTSVNFRYFTLVQWVGGGNALIWPVKIFFLPRLGFELEISGSLVLHSTTAQQCQLLVFHIWQFQLFNSGAEGLMVVLFWLELWGIFFLPTLGFELGTSGSLVLHSTTAPLPTSGFHLRQYQVFNSHAERLVVGLFWLDLWEIFFLPSLGFDLGTSGSLVLHSTTAPCQLLVFTSDNIR